MTDEQIEALLIRGLALIAASLGNNSEQVINAARKYEEWLKEVTVE